MTIRKTICALMALLLAISSAAFAEVTLSAGGKTPICSETVALTIAIPDDVYVEDYETNLQTLLLEE